MERRRPLALGLAALLAGAGIASAEDRAAALYYRGLDEVRATLPSSGLALPSTAMPCISCHGADGQGGREGGVAVPPISWRRLAMATADRPAYAPDLLARALRDGIGADGRPLHQVMPRYAISESLAGELARWLDAIEPPDRTGIDADEIVIAIPSAGIGDPRAAVIARTLRAHADGVNRQGGLFGRSIRLVEDGPERRGTFARLAALAPNDGGDGAPLDLWPLQADADDGTAFPLIPAEERLMRRLLTAARQDDPKAERVSEVAGDGQALPATLVFDGSADALATLAGGWSGPGRLTIYTTPGHADLARLQRLPARPLRIVLANPLAGADPGGGSESADRRLAFERAAARLRLSETERPTARAAWVAASMLEAALRATGRRLDRHRFEAALQALAPFDSGLLPPVHPTRGLMSIELVTFDFGTREITRRRLPLD